MDGDVASMFGSDQLLMAEPSEWPHIFERSPLMRTLGHRVHLVADTDAAVLLRGESGAGKDVIARAIHSISPRRDHPFVKVNCAALPTEILESELFGHEKGAFTGAYKATQGKFEIAHGGTLLLNEIGDMPVALQAKLLHVLQDREFVRVGGVEIISVDVRIVASTNRDLEAAVRNGQFRQDLYYRLKVIDLHVPPLRSRREEIPYLAQAFVDRFNEQYRRRFVLSDEALALLSDYTWPGNVRELENMMKRSVVLQDESLLRDELTLLMAEIPAPLQPRTPTGWSLRELARQAAARAERQAIIETLDRARWNRSEAAKALKVSYRTMMNKINQYGLSKKHNIRIVK
jgi:transcriptional regulator with GAF, ATPase, and Fis domain